MRIKFCAELGSNHNGNLLRGMRLIDAAHKAGFEAVKTQHFRVKDLFAPEALLAKPELRARERYELPEDWHETFRDHAHELGMSYGITPLYWDALRDVGAYADWWKISSYQITNLLFLAAVAQTGKPVVVSTGMATMEECLKAREALMDNGAHDITFLHCTSIYPAPPNLSNLKTIDNMQKWLCWPIGWSDHTVNEYVVLRAIWRWRASMIEMHLDLEDGKGSEAEHSWMPLHAADTISEAATVVPAGLEWSVPEMDGDGKKEPRPEEAHERLWRSDPQDGLRPTKEAR